MEEYLFNVDNGYLEGLVRGFRSGIMSRADYLNLVQCETIEGMLIRAISRSRGELYESEGGVCLTRLLSHLEHIINHRVYNWLLSSSCVVFVSDLKAQLQGTDYGNFLQNEPSPIPVAVIDDKLRSHLVVQFLHIRNQCTQPLATFLDYIT